MATKVYEDGEILYANDLNNSLKKIPQVVSILTSSLSNTEVNISSDVLTNRDYVVVKATLYALTQTVNDNDSPTVSLLIESKESGGSYSVDVNATIQRQQDILNSNSGYYVNLKSTRTYEFYHTLTPEEKSNGMSLRLTASGDGNGGNADVSNHNTSIMVMSDI